MSSILPVATIKPYPFFRKTPVNFDDAFEAKMPIRFFGENQTFCHQNINHGHNYFTSKMINYFFTFKAKEKNMIYEFLLTNLLEWG